MAHIAMKNYAMKKIWIVKDGQIVQNPLMRFTFMSARNGDNYKTENRYLFSQFSDYGHDISYFTYTVTQNNDRVTLQVYVRPYDGGYKNEAVSFELAFLDAITKKYYFKGAASMSWGTISGTQYNPLYTTVGNRKLNVVGREVYYQSGYTGSSQPVSTGAYSIDRTVEDYRYLYGYVWGKYEDDKAAVRMWLTLDITDFYYFE